MHMTARILSAILALLVSGCTGMQALERRAFTKAFLPGNLLVLSSADAGNVLAMASQGGVLLIDTGEPESAALLRDEIAAVYGSPVRAIICTHYHWDHSGGMDVLSHDAAVYATRVTRASWAHPRNGQQAITNHAKAVHDVESNLNILWGDEELEIEPVMPSHTSGDLIVWIRSRNAVHLGDLFQFDGYPSVGLPDGGTHKGTVRVLRGIIARTDDETLIIPGHGQTTSRAKLIAWTDMLDVVTTRIDAAVLAGKSLEEVVASQPTAEFDAEWGRGYLEPDEFMGMVYRDLTGHYRNSR